MGDMKPIPSKGFTNYYAYAVSLLKERNEKLEGELQEKLRVKRDKLIILVK